MRGAARAIDQYLKWKTGALHSIDGLILNIWVQFNF